MSTYRRNFLALAAVTAAAIPAWGQALSPAIINSGSASIPDFSGIWAHLSWPDFEPPLAGPGPVTNRSRRNGVSNIYDLVGDYTSPILKPHAAEVVRKKGELEHAAGPAPTPSNQCWPGGVPFLLASNIGMQMLQQPDKITILYSNDHEVRRVRLNQPHAGPAAPSWYGDSVGHYEGDTLVIDTVGVKIGPFAMLDMYGTPHSDALHVIERYRLLDYQAAKEAADRGQRNNFRIPLSEPGFGPDPNYRGKGLELQFTVEDEGVFTTPWSAAISYQRPLGPWPEMSCAETRYGFFGGKSAAMPAARNPDF
jgi:hypothetical protein